MGEVSTVFIERRIWQIRGMSVMLDMDLAELYGVSTKRLNEQVRRNSIRFPEGYAFRLTREEALQCFRSTSHAVALKRGQNIKHLSMAFTENGAVMLAAVLQTPAAVAASLRVVDAFVRMRGLIVDRDGLGRKVDRLEKRVGEHDEKFERVFGVLDDILPGDEPGDEKKIGFTPP